MLATAGSLILLVACAGAAQRVINGQGLLPYEMLEVEPGALREVSSIGTVVARNTVRLLDDHTVQVINLLIMDVGAPSFGNASAAARTALEGRGWVRSGSSYDDLIHMESPQWAFTSLTITPIRKLAGYGAEVADSVMKSPKADAYLLIDVTPFR
ncbi:hypothetical protein E1295_22100 [Nonomuraea mesophila]|uniref:LytR family transcriptional regulator n=1 Tax=Nonomuraea mesophila TaxID=2530382 RepID=A0A4R5FEX1_9ACTN|nr:hypothetical protein [Nonomuraea mesophila]TDE47936.1 hypothetical protein E1295_22100 [Nonomuraea mesophila]